MAWWRRLPVWGKAFLVIGVLAFGAWFFLRGKKADTQEYVTASVERGDVASVVSSSGSLKAVNTIDVGSQLSGMLTALNADYNTPVRKNQVLARIDPSTFQSRVSQSQAQMAIATAQIAQAKANVVSAQAGFLDAQRNYKTKAPLRKEGFVSGRDFQIVEAAVDSSRASVSAAQAAVQSAQAQLQQTQATLQQQKLDLERTYIRSPVNGVVIDRAVSLGQTVAASLQAPKLFTIAEDLRQMQVEVSVDEADIGGVRTGQASSFTVDAFPDRTFNGVVKQIRLNPTAAQNVVAYTVIVSADNPDMRLLPGMTATVTIELGKKTDVLKVPTAALRFKPKTEGESTGGESGGRQGGGGKFKARVMAELDLSSDQKKQVDALFAAQAAEMKKAKDRNSGLAGGPSFVDQREVMKKRMENMRRQIRDLLNDAQRAKFDAMQAERKANQSKFGEVYVLGADNTPQPRRVQIGMADDSSTEVLGGDVKVGDKLIVRAATKPAKAE